MDIIYEKTKKKLVNFRKRHFLKPDDRIRTYLAGPMEYAPGKDFGANWRIKLEKRLIKSGFSVFNPSNEVKLFEEQKLLKEINKNGFNFEKLREQFYRIIKIDLYEVLRSDVVLCQWLLDVPSFGTPSELTVAKLFSVPVLFVCKDIEQVPKWVLGCIDHFQKDFTDVEKIIRQLV
jgi:nucleoside 2-deoxyribosyltransferase